MVRHGWKLHVSQKDLNNNETGRKRANHLAASLMPNSSGLKGASSQNADKRIAKA